ncbi:tail fibers protein [Enterobacter phage vB-EclM_KMB17]|nr:tail fibers protein [Enterobacter phage vB-EclM_KMB17]
MATIKQIQFKRSNVAGKRPLPADIAEGELAINIKDSTLFTKNADGQIIDLGFAKGGQVDGNINQVSGNFTTVGDIKGKNVNATTNIVAETGEVRSNAGVLRTKAGNTSNSHVWFDGTEITGLNRNGERAVIYANPQTTSSGGAITYRVYDKSNSEANGANGAFFHMYGTGDFDASRDINATRDLNGQRAKLMVSVQTPQVITNNINTNASPFQTYGWEDLRTYSAGDGTIPLNYVYKGRAQQSGAIWHQLLTEQKGFSEWTLYTGVGPEFEQFSIKNGDINGGLGLFKNSLAVGDFYSTLGKGSIAIGDSDTGFRSDGDGAFSLLSNNSILATYSDYNETRISYRKPIEIISTNGSNIPVLPTNNSALVKIDTSTDGNNAAGNGLTFIGYNADNKYHHYFRGNGAFVVQMGQGLNIISGGINATGNSKFSNNLTAYALWSETDLFLTNNTRRHIVFRYDKNDGTSDNDGYIFKDGADNPNRRTGIRISASTPNKTSGNTQSSGEFVFEENGNFVLPSNGTIVQDYLGVGVYAQSLLHSGPTGNKNYLRKFRGDSGNTIFHETVQGSEYRISTGSTDTQDEMVISALGKATFGGSVISYGRNSLNQFRAIGGDIAFFIRNDSENTYFMLTDKGDPLGSYNGLRPLQINNSNGNVTIGHATQINGTLTSAGFISTPGRFYNGEYGGAINVTGEANGDGGSLISGAVGGGGWNDWQARPAGMLVSCRASDTSAHSIWKATHWGKWHIAAMDVHAPGGSAVVRLITNTGLITQWANDRFWCSHKIVAAGDISTDAWMYASEFYLNSDVRYKDNIIELESVKDKLHSVPVHRYSMKDGSNDNAIGVIAQEVEEVFPELVTTKEDGYKSVNYRALSTVLWKIVQEQDKEIEDVKSRLARIEELLSK